MISITADSANTIRFNASGELEASGYIMELAGISGTYTQDVTLNAPTVNNGRYLAFVVTDTPSPDTSDAEFDLPNPGEYYCTIYNTDSTKAAGVVIYRGVMVLHGSQAADTVYDDTQQTNVIYE